MSHIQASPTTQVETHFNQWMKFRLHTPFRRILTNAGLSLLYIVTALFGLQFATVNQSVTIIWPPGGIAIAALLLLGRRALPGILAGAFVVNLMTDSPPLAAGFIAAGNTLEALTALVLLGRMGFRPTFERMQDAFAFMVVGAGVSALVSATIGSFTLLVIGSITIAQLPGILGNWWLGDALGILVITPLILTWATIPGSPITRAKLIETLIVFVLMISLTVVVIFVNQDISFSQPLGYLAFPGLVWVSLRFDRREVISTSFAVSLLAILTIILVSERSPSYMQLLLNGVGLYLAALSITALLLSAALTERRHEALEAERARNRFARIFEQNPSAITITTLGDGRYIDTNQSFLNIVGYNREELLGKSSLNEVPIWESLADRQRMLDQLRSAGRVRDFATRFRAKSGQLRDVSISLDVIELNDEHFLLGMVLDETERYRVEAAARTSEARFQSIFESASIGIVVADMQGVIQQANPAMAQLLGYTPEELQGVSFRDVTHPDDLTSNVDLLDALNRGEIERYELEKRYLHRSGQVVWVQLTVSRFPGRAGDAPRIIGLVADITQRKQADQTLRQSEARFRTIFENAPIGISFDDEHGAPLLSNPAYSHILGYSPQELKELKWQDYTHPDGINLDEGLFKRLMLGEIESYQLDKRYVRKDGETIWGRLRLLTLPDSVEGSPHELALLEDITERRAAEETIRQSESRFRTIFENTPIGISFGDERGNPILTNAAYCHILGYEPELFQKTHWTEYTHPDDIALDQAHYARLVTGEISSYQIEKRYLRPNGDIIWGRLTLMRLLDSVEGSPRTLSLLEDITDRKASEAEILHINSTLEQRVHERTQELEAANTRLTELDRLKSLFIAEVSHELRTPLSILNTRVYLLERSPEDKRAEYIQGLREQIERLSSFVNSILDLSRIEGERHQFVTVPTALNPLVTQSIEALVPRAQEAGLGLYWDPSAIAPLVMANSDRLEQVITNLVSNALKYTRAGHVRVSSGLAEAGNRAWLRVQDTGIGIPPEDLPHIFDRFFRAENVSQLTIPGTGLGLSITREIVELHGGEINIESEIGVGTTVTVWLPLAPSRPTTGSLRR
jgi:PAS domain S-box-containing protein